MTHSTSIKDIVVEKIETIKNMELNLINGIGSFEDMMSETYKLLQLTLPNKKYHNTNTNQLI